MDRLDAMELFVAAVEAGSLAAAARRHGRSPASVTRAVALLEQHAGTTLLLRSTRKLSLTAAGEHHLAIWRDVLMKLEEVDPGPRGAILRGPIVVTAPELFGRMKLMPLVETFLDAHPQVSARLLLVNRLVNLIGEGVDLAVRLAPLPDSTLSAIKVGEIRTLFCASPEYLAARGLPTALQDLDRHQCIGLNAEGDAELWPFRATDRRGDVRSVRVQTRLSVSSAAAALDAARRGQGIVCARSYQVAEDIAAGRLARILAEFEPPPVPVNLLFPPDRARGGAVRALIDHLVPALKQSLLRTRALVP